MENACRNKGEVEPGCPTSPQDYTLIKKCVIVCAHLLILLKRELVAKKYYHTN